MRISEKDSVTVTVFEMPAVYVGPGVSVSGRVRVGDSVAVTELRWSVTESVSVVVGLRRIETESESSCESVRVDDSDSEVVGGSLLCDTEVVCESEDDIQWVTVPDAVPSVNVWVPLSVISGVNEVEADAVTVVERLRLATSETLVVADNDSVSDVDCSAEGDAERVDVMSSVNVGVSDDDTLSEIVCVTLSLRVVSCDSVGDDERTNDAVADTDAPDRDSDGVASSLMDTESVELFSSVADCVGVHCETELVTRADRVSPGVALYVNDALVENVELSNSVAVCIGVIDAEIVSVTVAVGLREIVMSSVAL